MPRIEPSNPAHLRASDASLAPVDPPAAPGPSGPLFGWIRSGSNPGFRAPAGRSALLDFWPRYRDLYASATLAELRGVGSTFVLTAAENLRDGDADERFRAAEARLGDHRAVESLSRIGVLVPITGGPDIGRAVVVALWAVRPSHGFPAEEGDELRAHVVLGSHGLFVGGTDARWTRSPDEVAPSGLILPLQSGTWELRAFVPAGSAYRDSGTEAPSCILDLWPA